MKNSNPQPIFLKDYTVPDYLIDKIELDVNLGEDATIVKSHMFVRANPASQKVMPNLVLRGEELELQAVTLNGQVLKANEYRVTADSLTILNVPNTFELIIQTRNKPQDNTALSGLYKSSGNFCTQCEPEGFRRITYFLDRPDVMSSFTTTVTADATRYPVLLSNGNPVAKGQLEGGKHWVRWEDPFKKPSYLFALVAGDLEFIEDFFVTQSGRRITLRIYVEKGNTDKCAHAMQGVKKAMRWDEENFGREYDLDIYMLVAVSDFNMGAMENKGLNIFNTKYILAKTDTATDDDFIHVESVIAHEYCHNWTGNRITCRDWFQLSLKEGLTIFRDQSFTEDTTSKAVARIRDVNVLRTQQFPEDAGPLAHPVRPDSYIEINNFYTATVYNKGAEVIRMMKTILGAALFRKGMDLYFDRHDGQAVTIDDFVKAMEDASKMDLGQFRLWYSQAGTPVLMIEDHYDATTKTYQLTIKQTCPPTPGQPLKKPMHIPVRMGLITMEGVEIPVEQSVIHVKNAVDVFEFKNIPSKPIPSLLRGFSAPVKLQYHYSDEALAVLFRHDSDEFNRWEAGQKYAVNVLLRLVAAYQAKEPLKIPADYIASFQHVLQTQQQDKWLLAEMLALPSEKYLAEQMSIVDVDAIHVAREFLLNEIATQAKTLFQTVYQQNTDLKSGEFDVAEVGKRQLKNLCLAYLMLLPDAAIYENVGMHQFKQSISHNMTDAMAALRSLTNVSGPQREKSLQEFYQAWKNDPLVVDKWFALQATSKAPGALSEVKKLLQHEAFDIKNPNKVYSLIGAFGGQNMFQFHAVNGEGYAFLSETIQKLDALNPQVAARMVKPLIEWKRFDKTRQELMRKQLEIISQNKTISKDVYELVSKSLE
ncbi:MAG: aminopeptidase N [Gammaproteobacteria bacterium]|nr:aminopeptidase N [Gammaproteobacteria bacterium]